MRLGIAVVAAATLSLLAGCGTSQGTTSSAAAGQDCTESTTRQVLDAFIDALNQGDIARLEQLLSDFVSYATDAPGAFSSPSPRSRSNLIAYFRQRHQVHERLKLESFVFHLSSTGMGEFEFEVTRSADDGLASTPFGGKGAVWCRTTPHTVWLWVMAREPYLRARLPLYGLVATLALAIVAGGVALGVRRRRGKLSESRPRVGAP